MLSWVMRASLPGGLPLVEALGFGLSAGTDPALSGATVLKIDDTGNPLKPQVSVVPRNTGGLLTQQEIAQLGLRQALLMPQVAGSLLSSSPALAYSLYKPIRDLGTGIVSPFRRAGIPQVTGLEGLPSLQELIADAQAGAKIAAGVMPPPYDPKSNLIGLAAGLLSNYLDLSEIGAQIWGLISGPGRSTPNPGIASAQWQGLVPSGTYSLSGRTRIQASWTTVSLVGSGAELCTLYGNSYNDGNDRTYSGVTKIEWVGSVPSTTCGGFNIVELKVTHSGGISTLGGMGASKPKVTAQSVTMTAIDGPALPASDFTIQGNYSGGPTVSLPWVTPDPLTIGSPDLIDTVPAVLEPAALTLPALPAYLPDATPINQPTPTTGQPAASPLSPWPIATTATGRASRSPLPALPAYLPPLVQPAPAQPITQTRPDGALVPTTAPPVVATDPGSVVPWPGAAPIPGTGLGPKPTLEGIAQELGKIERKIEVMNNPNAPGNLIDRFDGLEDFIRPLIEAIISTSSGTTYTLDSPCEVDAQGVKLPPVEVQAPGALTELGVIINRLDALAELAQVHKNLKQPNCRQKPPVGEFVTVNFEEI